MSRDIRLELNVEQMEAIKEWETILFNQQNCDIEITLAL